MINKNFSARGVALHSESTNQTHLNGNKNRLKQIMIIHIKPTTEWSTAKVFQTNSKQFFVQLKGKIIISNVFN